MNKCSKLLRSVRKEMRRELHSLEHAHAWAQFHKFLMYRANFTFLTKILYMAGFMTLGSANYQESEEFQSKKDSVYNRELAGETFVYVKVLIIFMGVTRLFLMLVSFKKLEVCKYYFYFMQVYKVVE